MTTVTDEKEVRCNIHNYDLPQEKRNELWEVANEIALLNRSTGLLNLFEKFWSQQAGFVVFERFIYACMNEYAHEKLPASVPVVDMPIISHYFPKDQNLAGVIATYYDHPALMGYINALDAYCDKLEASQKSNAVVDYEKEASDFVNELNSVKGWYDIQQMIDTYIHARQMSSPSDQNSKLKELVEAIEKMKPLIHKSEILKLANSLIQQDNQVRK